MSEHGLSMYISVLKHVINFIKFILSSYVLLQCSIHKYNINIVMLECFCEMYNYQFSQLNIATCKHISMRKTCPNARNFICLNFPTPQRKKTILINFIPFAFIWETKYVRFRVAYLLNLFFTKNWSFLHIYTDQCYPG